MYWLLYSKARSHYSDWYDCSTCKVWRLLHNAHIPSHILHSFVSLPLSFVGSKCSWKIEYSCSYHFLKACYESYSWYLLILVCMRKTGWDGIDSYCFVVVYFGYFHKNACIFQVFLHDYQSFSLNILSRVYDGLPTIVRYDCPDIFLEVLGVLPISLLVLSFPYFILAKEQLVWSQVDEALFLDNSN